MERLERQYETRDPERMEPERTRSVWTSVDATVTPPRFRRRRRDWTSQEGYAYPHNISHLSTLGYRVVVTQSARLYRPGYHWYVPE